MSLRNRIFLVFVLAAVVAVYGLIDWMSSEMRPRYLEAQEDLMVDLVHVLASQIQATAVVRDDEGARLDVARIEDSYSGIGRQPFSAQIYSLLKTEVDVRVYVTDAAGRVLFDSDAGRDLGRDNSDWRDIRLALAGEYGARSTEGDPMFPGGATMYVSTALRDDGQIIGAVSVGKPTRNAERFLAAAVRRFSQAGLIALGMALLIALVLYRWVSRPMQRLHDYARALSAGQRVPEPALGDNEIGRVGAAMTELRDALDGKAYVEQYVQTLTHELKSPTAAIAGAAELLDEDLPRSDRERFVANIRAQSARLQALIERMLELAEIENRPALARPEPLELDGLLDEAVESLAPQLHHKALRIDRRVDAGLRVRGERFLLLRALVNLIGNAVDFSPMHATIDVQASAEGERVRIRIADQGPGIPDYARERIFERFYSLPRDDGTRGTGLGLSFVAQIAALHHGAVTVATAADGGGLATLDLPRAADIAD